VVTGPTGTNVADLVLVLVEPEGWPGRAGAQPPRTARNAT
jgi:hypothetical protein